MEVLKEMGRRLRKGEEWGESEKGFGGFRVSMVRREKKALSV